MSAIGTGEADLTKRLKIKTKDEIGILSSGFNIFVDTLQKLAKKTTDASANLFQQAQVLSSILEEVTSLSDEINASVQQVAQDSSKQLQISKRFLNLQKQLKHLLRKQLKYGKGTTKVAHLSWKFQFLTLLTNKVLSILSNYVTTIVRI